VVVMRIILPFYYSPVANCGGLNSLFEAKFQILNSKSEEIKVLDTLSN